MKPNEIHPTAVIGDGVDLGSGNYVGPYAVVMGPCRIGDDNWIGPHLSIGTPGQWSEDHGTEAVWTRNAKGVHIGDRNVLRESVTVQQGNDRPTVVGSECYFMAGVHVNHDGWLDDEVTLSNSTLLAGHTRVHWRANLGLGSAVHQRCTVGPLAMVGMNAAVVNDVPPMGLVVGVPARLRGANIVGMTRAGIAKEDALRLDAAYREGEDAADLLHALLDRLGQARWRDRAPAQENDGG